VLKHSLPKQSVCIYNSRTTETSNPLKHEARAKILKTSVRTAKKTPHFTVTKINRLTVFKEIIAVYCDNRTKHINTLCGQNAVTE
jgi:hypothetical protein